MPALYIPEPNPVRFCDSPDLPDGYSQKYAPADVTCLQFTSRNVSLDVTVDLIDSKNRLVRSMTPRVDVLSGDAVNETFFYTLTVGFDGLAGHYRIRITAEGYDVYGRDILEKYWSGCLHVCEKHGKLHLLQYKNSKNKDSVNYSLVDSFALRAEGGFLSKNYTPRSDDTVYQNRPANFTLLHSDTYFTRRYHAGGALGIPDSMHLIIHKAWGCDSVFVDGTGYVKYTGAEWEASEASGYPMRTWVVDVAPTGKTLELRYDDVLTADWGVRLCLKKDGIFTGYAAAWELTVKKTSAFDSSAVRPGYPKTYSILESFNITADQFATLENYMLKLYARAFLGRVSAIEGDLGMTAFNLVSKGDNLTNGSFNLVNKTSLVEAFIIKSDYCNRS